MSAYNYDKAVIDRLQTVLTDKRIRISPADTYMSVVAKLQSDEIKLPLVSVTRTGMSKIAERTSHAQIFTGDLSSTKLVPLSTSDLKKLQFIPIRINYQLDVWSYDREENDSLIRELVWLYSQHPTHLVDIPYGLNIRHNFNIFMDDDIEDNSDVVNHSSRGEYFRQTLNLYTDDAYLWKTSQYINPELCIYLHTTNKP